MQGTLGNLGLRALAATRAQERSHHLMMLQAADRDLDLVRACHGDTHAKQPRDELHFCGRPMISRLAARSRLPHAEREFSRLCTA